MKNNIVLTLMAMMVISINAFAGTPKKGFYITGDKVIMEVKKGKGGSVRMRNIVDPFSNQLFQQQSDGSYVNSKGDTLRYIKEEKTITILKKDNTSVGLKYYSRFGGRKNQLSVYTDATKWKLDKLPLKGHLKNSGRINGKAWRFLDIKATISRNGLMTVKAIQETRRAEGFTGRVFARLLDKNGNEIAIVEFDDQGLDSEMHYKFPAKVYFAATKHYRKEVQLNLNKYPHLLLLIDKIELFAGRDGSGKDVQYFANQIDKASKKLKTAAELYAKANGAN